MDVKIHPSWKKVLKEEFNREYFLQVTNFVRMEKMSGKIIYPPGPLIFNAFNQTPFNEVKVVILGQDPYHGKGQAHGLSFSVPQGVKPPPSLVNIFKELSSDIGLKMLSQSGDLTPWAKQGVLLLNAALTVREGEPFSHANYGWAEFTDNVIRILSEKKENLVFILWGNFARQKQTLIDETKHLVLFSAHPSPFSADKGFFGCKHFSKTNTWLVQHNIAPINWMV